MQTLPKIKQLERYQEKMKMVQVCRTLFWHWRSTAAVSTIKFFKCGY
jgi:hypothetical protein